MKSVYVKSRRNSSLIALAAAAVAGFGAMNTAKAIPYTYTPSNGTTDVWSAGTGWDGIPVSNAGNTLRYVADNTTELAGGLTNINTDDNAGQFLAGSLTLQGTGPSSGGAASITIAMSGLATGLTLSNPTSVALSALAGTSGLTYTVSAPITLGATSIITGNGTANFNFSGGLSSSTTNLTKSGTSALTLGGTNTLSQMSVGLNGVSGEVRVSSGATLSIGSAGTGALNVGAASNAVTTAGFNGTLDVSQATSFTTNVATVGVGYNVGTVTTAPLAASGGTLSLGLNNNITATTAVRIGEALNVSNQPIAGAFATTAAGGATTITTPILRIGYGKANASFTLGAGSTVTVLGTVASGGRTALDVGTTTFNTSGAYIDTLDASTGVFNGTLNSLVIGSSNSSLNGSTTSTVTLSANALNHLDISGASTATQGVVTVGRNLNTTATATGTLTIGNLDASSTITDTANLTAIMVGFTANATPASVAVGTLNLNGGTLNIVTTGTAIGGSAPGNNTAGSSTVNFNGVTLKAGGTSTNWISNLTTANLAAGGLTVDSNGNNLTTAQVFSGTGNLIKQGAGTLTLTGINTYTGNTIVSAGTLALADNAGMTFLIGANGVNNSISGAGTITLDGDFTFNLSGASTTAGDSWTIVSGGYSFGSNFTVAGFTPNGTVWTDGTGTYSFNQTTGVLTAVPEPGTLSFLVLSGGLVLAVQRARRRASRCC